jgi:hypothetical protein
MDAAADFRWPDDPEQAWWETEGAGLGLSAELIRFAAALQQLGGADGKKNSVAARLAGINCGRTQAFRYARSVKVRRLLDLAEEIRSGERKSLTKEEIRFKIEDLIRSPDAGTAAKGIELLSRWDERERAANKDEGSGDPHETLAHIESEFGPLASLFFSTKVEGALTTNGQRLLDSFCPHCRELLVGSIPNCGFPGWGGTVEINGHADVETADAA